ncbi:dihydroxyacetone kinase-like protein [Secundilactobacillus malefermentans DSM 5705 = KCTC 3548]|nr:DAK2 domain-containing protein [Secundilactobacillus malefermentans]KRM59651.1 dihydroxyacetone kinase-like protein [Secundilactobacillus malefermentans DSM 5705 = KCTC 3548]QEA32561.1 DAK2 domain-containing protein [Secundilactobacillus malefermentans]
MVQAASTVLNQNAEFINSLNVFPVPDGDTGTNMSLSLASGLKYEREETSDSVGKLSVALAKGLLMGARGNSGVILSQIFRGFSKSIEEKPSLDAQDLAEALSAGAETAYKAVMKPTEGTILTVVREAAQAARNEANEGGSVVTVMDKASEAAKVALASTPDLLPVLKQVGVVDSGGQGLAFVLSAFDDILNGREISEDQQHQPDNTEMDEMIDAEHHRSVQGKLNPDDIVYGYCTEIMVRIGKGKEVDHKFDYDTFYKYLADLGDSLLVVNDDEVVKVHVHTEHPGKVMAWGQSFGDLAKVKVDNMRLQQETIIENDAEEAASEAKASENIPETAIIAVASGEGIQTLFKSLGVTHIISGGQTMNPSTEDIVNAINDSQAKEAIILPNNKNIFLSAEQAAEVADIPTKVVHSRSISQGMTALLGFNPESDLDGNTASMEENLSTVKSGEVTHAIRDTELDGIQIKKGDFMGIVDGKIKVTRPDMIDTSVAMVQSMLDEDSEIVTIIYGTDATEEEANKIEDAVMAIDGDLEVEIHEGDQPVYPFVISVE